MNVRSVSIALLATMTSAALFGWAFPPAEQRILAWFALVPFFVALRRVRLREALLLTWIWCVFAAYFVGDWFPSAVADYFHQSAVVAIALFVAVFTLMAAPYYMAFAWAYRMMARTFTVSLPIWAAAAWVVAEFGRGRLFTTTALFIGNPWGLVGYSQTDLLPLSQIASVTGVYGISFLVACVNAALAELAIGLWEERTLTRARLAGVGVSLVPTVITLACGALALERGAPPVDTRPMPVAIVQGNLALGAYWRPEAYGEHLDTYLRLTASLRDRAPEMVFWPESAMTFFVDQEPLYRRAIARVLAPMQAELVAGGPRASGSDRPVYFNTIFVIGRDGGIQDSYDKEYLVPFAEYFPLGVDLLERNFGRVRYFAHGRSGEPLDTRAGPAGVVVCNEVMFPEVVGARVAAGATYLLNPSNDSWISDPKYTEQQFDFAVLRAIEQRRYLVRASTAGPSAIIDPWGRVPARTPSLESAVLIGEIRALEERSFYGQYGDFFALACVIATMVACVVNVRSGPRA